MTKSAKTISCTIHFKRIDSDVSLDAVTEIISKHKHPSILGGNNANCKANRFSTWAVDPLDVFTFTSSESDPFGKLKTMLDMYSLAGNTTNPLPEEMFPCGWIGFFSYDLGRHIEKMPETTVDDLNLPLMRLCFYDRAICYDHREEQWYLIALQMAGSSEDVEAKFDHLAEIINEAKSGTVTNLRPAEFDESTVEHLDCNMSRDYYFEALEKTRHYIYDGEVYQINFSQRFRCDYDTDAIKLYHWQNKFNPSPYAAYISADDFSIVSASPELFLKIQNNTIVTKPIKGTRPRLPEGIGSEDINRDNYAALVTSEKDQAELYMIIDLERNDLTRICQYGSIEVIQPRTIEAYPTVFHAVATVQGQLRNANSPQTFCDILMATFPGGSITGAPKIRSMEIIDELEPTARSVYTGSIGFIGIDLNVCLNIAIRTVIIKGSSAYVQVGGGIVADSDTHAEWDETITKARALLAGIAAVNNKEI